jgi:hypothetical protein
MSKPVRPVAVIYNVGDLKEAFEAIKGEQFQLGGADQSAPTGQAQCAYKNAEEVLKKLAYYNPEDYLCLPAIPSELATQTDPHSKTFLQYYKDGKCVGVPKVLAYRLSSVDLD